jgi:hypothetical protein
MNYLFNENRKVKNEKNNISDLYAFMMKIASKERFEIV